MEGAAWCKGCAVIYLMHTVCIVLRCASPASTSQTNSHMCVSLHPPSLFRLALVADSVLYIFLPIIYTVLLRAIQVGGGQGAREEEQSNIHHQDQHHSQFATAVLPGPLEFTPEDTSSPCSIFIMLLAVLCCCRTWGTAFDRWWFGEPLTSKTPLNHMSARGSTPQ